jgi:molybdopterin converting factor small subunit
MSLKIKDLFKKSIDRNIEGVVTIGNEADEKIFQELDEFVVTAEIVKHFRTFFKKYRESLTTTTGKMGIWISGYFGSGKSHFLKMLGYIIENKKVSDLTAPEFFQDKIQDQTVFADLEKSANSNTKVIIFNIDSKAGSGDKAKPQAIMDVMLRTFNEAVGLSATIPWVADLERELIKEEVYESFQSAFIKYSKKDWKNDGRNQAFLNRNNIIKALVDSRQMDEESARKYFDDQVQNFTMTTEHFAKTVADYCKTNKKRVAFLMDEVGQFVGRNTELMLNLQTCVEDLAKYCEGKALVIVTSQQELKEMVDATQDKKLDFSKIQSRFERILLSGSNADEVIKKRILDKKKEVVSTLESLFETNEARLSNLIIFDQKPTWNGYRGKEDFKNVYPFVSYQFELLQKVFNAIRDHGMTEGKHLSQNERSLLNAFQESSKDYSDLLIGVLVPFDDFYQTVDNFIDYDIKTVFTNAQKKSTLNEFDIRVLKLLFMIKYVKEMPATIDRLATLMVSSINEDKITLKGKIETSLKSLEDETLIQKTSLDTYDFLTNEEQDVNRQINATAYDEGEIVRTVAQMLYEEVLQDQKIKYGKYEFPFNRFVDSQNIGQNNPSNITCKAVTGFSGKVKEWDFVMESSGTEKLIIDLQEGAFISELIRASRIAVFKQNHLATMSPTLAEILQKKSVELSDRRKKAQDSIRLALKNADIYANGTKLELSSKDAKERVFSALKKMVESKYHNLGQMGYSFDTISAIIDELNTEPPIIGDWLSNDANKDAYEEIKSKLKSDKQVSRISTVKSLVDYFVKSPYGWKELDIRGCIGVLWKHGLVSLDLHGKSLSISSSSDKYEFSKGNKTESLSVKLQEKIDDELLDQVKRAFKTIFNETIALNEGKLRKAILETITIKVEALKNIQIRFENKPHPGKEKIIDLHKDLSSIIKNDDSAYIFSQFITKKEILEENADILEEILSFYQIGSAQLKNYDDAIELCAWYDQNRILESLTSIDDVMDKITKILSNPLPFKQMVDLGQMVVKARNIKDGLRDKKVKSVKERLEKDINTIRHEHQEALSKVTEQFKINKLNETLDELESKYKNLISSIEQASNLDQYITSSNSNVEGFKTLIASLIAKSLPGKKTKNIRLSTLVPVANKKISSSQDVDKVIENIKKLLLVELKDNDELNLD